jgi:hypothetical protein
MTGYHFLLYETLLVVSPLHSSPSPLIRDAISLRRIPAIFGAAVPTICSEMNQQIKHQKPSFVVYNVLYWEPRFTLRFDASPSRGFYC